VDQSRACVIEHTMGHISTTAAGTPAYQLNAVTEIPIG
jgi:hypothetical protein